MNKSEVFQTFQSVFDSAFLDSVTVTPDLSAKDVEEWDSLLHVSLVLAVEDAFGVRFRVGEVEAVKNMDQWADLILRKLNK